MPMSIERYSMPWLVLLGMLGVYGTSVAQDVPHYLPPSSQANANPQSMIVISNDHQLFYKAYTDWSDIDGDGEIDSTFDPEIMYYGYFNSNGCYKYKKKGGKGKNKDKDDVEENVFKYSRSADNDFSCKGNEWSGNLLNWATMTRIDILRKVLYGGKRYRDNDDDSVILERAFLPHDAHSFTKIITNPNIIENYTPFKSNSGNKGTGGSVTFCNTTYHSGNKQSQEVTAPPLLRVAKGVWRNWAANEQWQCIWRGENGRSNSVNLPRKHEEGVGEKDYHVLVEVCAGNDNINCEDYRESDEDKPVGLLHEYAQTIDFGLISGSYENNKSGGVLRSNIKPFDEEFDEDTGVFTTEKENDRIVGNIDAFRIARYSYSNGRYNDTDNCPWGEASFGEGNCSNWGNPFAEMTLEALRYLTHEGPTDDFAVGTGEVEEQYIDGLTSPAWPDWGESGADTWCAAHSMILINSSESSFDSDSGNDVDDLEHWSLASFSQIKAATDAAGELEGLSGDYFFGKKIEGGGEGDDELCTAKKLNGLSEAQGICPGAPRLAGSYYVAGLSKLAHENPVVKNPANPSEGSTIDTYAVRLSANLPLIEVLGDNNETVATLVPACENTGVAGGGRCAIVDFRQDQDDPQKFQIIWEDSEFGGDYDSDLRMELSYDYKPSIRRLTVTTEVLYASTSKNDGQMGVGYVISGGSQRYASATSNSIIDIDSDGFIAHSGIYNYDSSLCTERVNGCQASDGPSSQSYKVGGTASASALPPPLYFAGKYGNDGINADGSPSAYFEVGQIGELVGSLAEVLDEVLNSAERSGASVELDAKGNRIFRTKYNNIDGWSGDIEAYVINDDGLRNLVWSARKKMPAPDDRTIITWLDGDGERFRMQGNLEPFVDYLRGDASNEQPNGSFRRRPRSSEGRAPLGDIIGSKPYFVGSPNTYYVPQEGDRSYADFRTEHAGRDRMIYVGANDGMLHGFNARTGVEELAYIPGLLLEAEPNFGALAELIDPDYLHRYYVDGSPTVLDVRFDGVWISLLASGLGSGGKGVFALNVTDPDAFSENNAKDIALWEFGPDDDKKLGEDEEEHLGYVYDKPSIVQLEDGSHAVVFGNGYFSKSGKASLYILPVDAYGNDGWDEDEVKRLTPGRQGETANNGLSAASLIDSDGNGRVDLAYAGDLQGNIWRFDLQSENPDSWHAEDTPLFQATRDGIKQVVTTGIEVGAHPKGGLMLFFATGGAKDSPIQKVIEPASRLASGTLYAVRDTTPTGALSPVEFTSKNIRSIKSASFIDAGGQLQEARYLTSKVPTGDSQGWRVDLFVNERSGRNRDPLLRGNRIVYTTIIPSAGCGIRDEGYLYELNAYNGNAFDEPVLDIDSDGEVNADDIIRISENDVVPIGIKTQGALYTPVVRSDGDSEQDEEQKISSNTAGELLTIEEKGSIPLGRVSWRELEN